MIQEHGRRNRSHQCPPPGNNLVRAVMVKAAKQQNVTPDRISFIDTIRWPLLAQVGEEIPKLVVNKKRERHEPRVIKDLPDSYRKMTRPRGVLQKELKNSGEIS